MRALPEDVNGRGTTRREGTRNASARHRRCWLSFGAQGVSLPHVSNTNGIWYRNFALRQGWTDYGLPLGQQLAGDGRELRLSANADLLDARVRLGLAGFTRTRGDYNLLAPQQAGSSRGAVVRLSARLGPAFDLGLEGAAESGDGWSTGEMVTSLRWMTSW